MREGMTPEQTAEMKLKHRIRWSCMLHNVRDSTGEHERQLLEQYMPPNIGPEHELYGMMYGIFESMHKYCKKLLKDGVKVCFPRPPPPFPPSFTSSPSSQSPSFMILIKSIVLYEEPSCATRMQLYPCRSREGSAA